MEFTVPLATGMTIAVVIAVRYFGLRLSHALLAMTAGFLIAGTVAAPTVHNILTAITTAVADAANHL